MIDLKMLRQLIRLMRDNDLSELDLRDQDEQVTLKRDVHGGVQPIVAPAPPHAPAAAPQTAPTPAPAEAPAPTDDGLIEIRSPMVGTFYSAASPDADPFVRVGTSIDEQTVVCLIEAMKVFNEIKAEVNGRIDKVLVGNGEAVEHDQPLFLVRSD